MTAVAGTSVNSPVPTGERLPLASGSPSLQISHLSFPPSAPTGASSSMNSTPSSMAITSSSSSAGMFLLSLLYTRRTCSTPGCILAALATSMAVFPPPMTTTSVPISTEPGAAFTASRNSRASISSPYFSVLRPGAHAPMATMISVKPSSFSS